MKPTRGFSLVELVLVLVITAVLAAFAIANLRKTETDATWFAEEVRGAVRYAQRQAVAQRRAVHVVVAPAQLSLCYDAGCGTSLTRLTTGQPYVLAAPSGTVLGPPGSFSFNGLGQPSGAAAITVGAHTVSVTAETGYVP